MPITFVKKKKTQQYLIFVFMGLVLITIIFLAFKLLKKEEVSPLGSFESPRTKINIEILKDPVFEYLQPFDKIPPFEGEVGRENPFIPY